MTWPLWRNNTVFSFAIAVSLTNSPGRMHTEQLHWENLLSVDGWRNTFLSVCTRNLSLFFWTFTARCGIEISTVKGNRMFCLTWNPEGTLKLRSFKFVSPDRNTTCSSALISMPWAMSPFFNEFSIFSLLLKSVRSTNELVAFFVLDSVIPAGKCTDGTSSFEKWKQRILHCLCKSWWFLCATTYWYISIIPFHKSFFVIHLQCISGHFYVTGLTAVFLRPWFPCVQYWQKLTRH